jgi:hypothetical protein
MIEIESLKQQFNGHAAFRERRPGVIQVLAPLFHEDGDMVDIFLDEPSNGSNRVVITDHGMTLMRLTYTYELDTENKQRIFYRISPKTGYRKRMDASLLRRNGTASIPRYSSSHKQWPRCPACSSSSAR